MTKAEISYDLNELRNRIGTLRDEIRVKVHLAGMDARDAFQVLDKEAEAIGRDVARVSQAALTDLASRLKKLADSI